MVKIREKPMNQWDDLGYPYCNHPIVIGFSLVNHPFWGTVPLFLVQHPHGKSVIEI